MQNAANVYGVTSIINHSLLTNILSQKANSLTRSVIVNRLTTDTSCIHHKVARMWSFVLHAMLTVQIIAGMQAAVQLG